MDEYISFVLESTSRKYYILNYSQRQGLMCAMRCKSAFVGDDDGASEKKIASVIEEHMNKNVIIFNFLFWRRLDLRGKSKKAITSQIVYYSNAPG